MTKGHLSLSSLSCDSLDVNGGNIPIEVAWWRLGVKRAPVEGIVYSVFDEKLGPKPLCWSPPSIDPTLLDLASKKSMNLTFGIMEESTNDLAMLPLSSKKVKALVQVLKIRHHSFMGGFGERTISLLFPESEENLLYEHIQELKNAVNPVAENFLNNWSLDEEKELAFTFIKELHETVTAMLEDLQKVESVIKSENAFPPDLNSNETGTGNKIEFKIIVCGEPQVGKTTLLLKFVDGAYRKTYIPSIGVNILEKIVNMGKYSIEFVLWDIAGEVKFSKIRQHFYDGAMAQLYVFDLTREHTLVKLADWYDDVQENIGSDAVGIIAGNKKDLKARREVNEDTVKEFAESRGMQYITTSSLTGENVERTFQQLGRLLLARMGKI
ncbi:GTP-binding protein [Candidatus Bathyarchaeota archaeon]|nr:GTP-binding protein [Candidatus Bathyarchaeota archaeon]